jgi:REP element-mobilizing transposase RayT
VKTFYYRHLPHYHPPNATYFITFRVAGSLPADAIERLQQERTQSLKRIGGFVDKKCRVEAYREHQKGYLEKFDALLDGATTGPRWLGIPQVAEIVSESIHYRDQRVYDLLSYCIMPNHVHMVFVGRSDTPTYRILQSLKRHTARQANLVLQRQDTFWQEESYDHVIRDGDELEQTIRYVLWNPVKAGLVESWEEWRWSYCKDGLL